MSSSRPAQTSPYRLVRTPPRPARAMVPDAEQAQVLVHPGGPLLVLAGPGTGKIGRASCRERVSVLV